MNCRLAALILFVCLVPFRSFAGGSYVEGIVSEFSGGDGNYSFRFTQHSATEPLLQDCPVFSVAVRYSRVPWFSWLPFVHSGHPTKAHTEAAAKVLQQRAKSGSPVSFGYIGNGLAESSIPCAFRSKGLAVLEDGEHSVIVSYHDPT